MKDKTNKLSKNRKGYVMILDAIIAVIILAAVFTVFLGETKSAENRYSTTTFKNIHYISEDAIDVLNKQGILDEIGTEWAAANGNTSSPHWSNATNIAKEYLDKLIPPNIGYKLIIDDVNIIYDSNLDNESTRPKENTSSTKTFSSRLLVGYGRGLPVRGHVARAFLTNIKEKLTSSYAYFGGFEGQGNITKKIVLPSNIDTVKEICLEYNAGDNFQLKIDGVSVPQPFTKSIVNMSAEYRCIANPETYIPRGAGGTHTFELSFTGSDIRYHYIAGGFIKIKYNTTILNTNEDTGTIRYEFPGIAGLINLYSSFYVPGTLNSMNAYLRFLNNYSTFLAIGDVRVFNTFDNASRKFCSISGSDYTCNIPNANLSQLLNAGGITYADLSQKTIPLRMGTENLTGVRGMIGTADVVLITDVSGSMMYRIGYNDSITGTPRDCNDPNLYKNDTRKISLAKCIDKEFINQILSNPENRVGLVAFSTNANSYINLTNNNVTLINEVDSYTASGGTCICCSINRAIQLLSDSLILIPQSSEWLYRRYSSCGDSCDPTTSPASCTPTGWQTEGFDDSSWNTISLPQSQSSWTNRVTYYRKHFTLPTTVTEATLYVRNRRGVECYLNGNLVGSDTSCSTGDYWDNAWNIPSSYFNAAGDNVLACRVRAGWLSGVRNGIEFDAKLVAVKNTTNNKYIIVMTDGIASYHCGGCSTPPTCSGTCNATTGSSITGCSGSSSDCTGTACRDAMEDAVCAAKKAYDTYGIKVYSIGFGDVSGCPNGRQTLEDIAYYGNATYYGSSDAKELKVIYDVVAESILNSTYRSQSVDIEGSMVPSILYPESYIEFKYTPPEDYALYGEISLTQDTGRFNDSENCTGTIYTPKLAKIVDAKVTSYSAEHWTDYVAVNASPVYSLRDLRFGDEYSVIGDPYIINIPPAYLTSGVNNTLLIGTGDTPNPPHTGCSPDNRAIYTIRLNERVSYGNVFFEKNGCNWTIEFEDGSNISEMIPRDYNGTKKCLYTQNNISYDTNDAVDDAIYRLLTSLDANNNKKIDIKFDSTMIEFDYSRAGGVKSLWGPISMKLVIWM